MEKQNNGAFLPIRYTMQERKVGFVSRLQSLWCLLFGHCEKRSDHTWNNGEVILEGPDGYRTPTAVATSPCLACGQTIVHIWLFGRWAKF